MRAMRTFLATVMTGALVLVTPADVAANGGAYLEFDRTHYLPGDAGVAVGYARVPAGKEHLFERGPFYLFAVPGGTALREGRPLPPGAIRLGTFTIEEEQNAYYELRAAFIAPDLPPGSYGFALCNDPCTVAGFREPFSGTISIVETRREARLLTANDRLRGKLYAARREARRAERRLEVAEAALDDQLAYGAAERDQLTAEIEQLETRLAAARTAANTVGGRSPFDPWVVGGILLVTLAAAVLAFRRRRAVPALTKL